MEKKSNNYYITIDADFLFDRNNSFKSRYTPWIYVYLKLEHNYYMNNLSNKTTNLNTNEIADFLKIDRATVHRSLSELKDLGLVIRGARNTYKIVKETKERNSQKNYVRVYKNLFIEMFSRGGTVYETLVYFYMIQNNRHYAFDYNFLKSPLTQSRLSRELRVGQRKVKTALSNLKNFGLVCEGESRVLYTKSPKTDWKLRFEEEHPGSDSRLGRKEDNEVIESSIDLDEQFNKFNEELYGKKKPKEPEVCLWLKSRDGQYEIPVVRLKDFGLVRDGTRRRKADGIPLTNDEWERQTESFNSLENRMYRCNQL